MNLFKCKEKWQKAFPNLDITDEEKKKLYEKYSVDLMKPMKDPSEFYMNKENHELVKEILKLKKKLRDCENGL